MLEDSFCIDCDVSLPYGDNQDLKNSFGYPDLNPTPYKVLGRKINSETFLAINPENPCRYPLPVQISICKPKRSIKSQLEDISNRPRSQNSKPRYKSKTPEPVKANVPRAPSELKRNFLHKSMGKSIVIAPTSKVLKKKTKISVEIPQSVKENSTIKKNINSIVMQTLKKQHLQKKQQEKSKVQEKERQKQAKKQLEDLNKNTRAENFNRFRQEKFRPKCPWGTDERRITRVNDVKILKEAEELRKKRREERERSKSAGRGRIGLDVLRLKREHSKIQEEETPYKKQMKEKDKSVLQFMKKQKKDRQKSREVQQERLREEEHKRLLQLLELERLTKSHQKHVKSSKSHKKSLKKSEVSIYDSEGNYSEDEEVMEILHGANSITPDSYEIRPHINSFDYKQSGRECIVFGVFPENSSVESKGNITQLVNDIVEKREKSEENLPKASSTMPLSDVKATYSAVNTEEEERKSSSSNISKRKEEIKKKLAELRNRVDRAKENRSEDYDAKRISAVIKIQAMVRGVLTRQALRRYFEEIDEQTPQESEDYDWMFEKKFAESNENSSQYDDYEANKIMIASSTSRSFEYKTHEKSTHKQLEIEKILKSQVEWREKQKAKLILLKNKDLEEMQIIAKKVGSEDLLMKHFEEIIERRYAHIDQLFDENIEAVKSAVQQAIEEGNPESLLHTLEKQENFASNLFQKIGNNEEMGDILKLKHGIDLKNIWNYSESAGQSVRISELDLASNSERILDSAERSSIESFPMSFQVLEVPQSLSLPLATLEPNPSICPDELLDVLTTIIGQECYLEQVAEAWELILTGSSFINEAAEMIFSKLLNQERDNFSDFYKLLQKTPVIKEFLDVQVPLLQLRPVEVTEKVGIAMDENYLLEYIHRLFDYLIQINFDIEKVLNSPSPIDPVGMLCKMQEAEIGVMIEKSVSIRILPLHLYLNLEKEGLISTQLQEAQHIHNKMLFDVVNESLLNLISKPEPMPWSLESQNLVSKSLKAEVVQKEVLVEVKNLNKVHAGKLPIIENISNSQDTEEDLIQQLREEQLSSMLAVEIIAQEPIWVNYEFEETQVKLDLADMTLEHLVEEVIRLLQSI